MELILKETIDSLGREGDLVKVKPGFGRNYLLPQGKAVLATASNLELFEQNKAAIQVRLDGEKKTAEKLSKKLAAITLDFAELVGDDERLFGSVTTTDICDKLKESGIIIEKKYILLADPIKTLGENKVAVKVGFDLSTEITVNVVAQGENN